LINKKSDFLASAASFIPVLGGSIEKSGNDQSITGSQSTPGFLGQLTKEIVLDPPVDAVKDLSSSANLAYSGDHAGAGGKFLSGVGNAILTGSSFVPALGVAGKGIRLLSKITGAGAKALKLTNAASKINRAGAVSSKFLRAPKAILGKTPVLGVLTGNKNIFKYTKPQAGQKFLQPSNLLRLSGNTMKGVVNSAPTLGAGLGLSGAGSLMYSYSPSGQMDSMLNSSVFSDIIGKDLTEEISGLSSKDKLRVFQHLKNKTDIPERVLGDWTNS